MKYSHLGLIYVCSPYTHDDPDVRHARLVAVAKATEEMISLGLLAYSPICHTVPIVEHGGHGSLWGDWAAYDETFLNHCSTVLVLQLEGWTTSRGVAAEIWYAIQHGLPVFGVNPCDVSEAVDRLVVMHPLSRKGGGLVSRNVAVALDGFKE
jgi:hypothetical protein